MIPLPTSTLPFTLLTLFDLVRQTEYLSFRLILFLRSWFLSTSSLLFRLSFSTSFGFRSLSNRDTFTSFPSPPFSTPPFFQPFPSLSLCPIPLPIFRFSLKIHHHRLRPDFLFQLFRPLFPPYFSLFKNLSLDSRCSFISRLLSLFFFPTSMIDLVLISSLL